MNLLSEIHQRSDNALRVYAGTLLAMSVAAIAVWVVVRDPIAVLLAVTVGALTIGLVLDAILKREPQDRRELARWLIDLHWPTRRHVMWALTVAAVGLGVRIGVGLLKDATASETTTANHSVTTQAPPPGIEIVGLALFVVIVGPLIEELVFRGVLQRFLSAYTGEGIAIGLIALVFAVLHIPNYGGFGQSLATLVIPMGVITVDAILWGVLYWQSRNVAVPFVAHGTSNLIALLLWIR